MPFCDYKSKKRMRVCLTQAIGDGNLGLPTSIRATDAKPLVNSQETCSYTEDDSSQASHYLQIES